MHFWMIQRFAIGYFNTIILSLQWILLNVIWSVFFLNKNQKISQHEPLDGARAAVILRTWPWKRSSLSRVTLSNPWTAARQAPLSMGILQARMQQWVAMSSSRGSSPPRDQTEVFSIAGGFFTVWATGTKTNKQTIVGQGQPASGAPVILLLWILFCFEIVVNQTLRNSYLINSAV